LSQALDAIRNRGRGVSIDGIYSILGLLPYGDKVEVEYKSFEYKYTKEELEQALMKVMREAVETGRPDPLT